MKEINDWTHIAMESMVALGKKVMSELPNIIGALFLIVLGWLIARILAYAIGKALRVVKFDVLAEKINADEVLEKAHIKIKPSQIVAKFVYWVIILLFFVTASDTLGWTVVSASISDLLSYLPKLFSAIVIFVIGLYIAGFVKKALKGIFSSLSVASGSLVSTMAFYIIVVIITLTALSQAGVDTGIITSNVTLILGGIILAFAVSFGLSSKDVMTNILSSYYSRGNFKIGQKIRIGDHEGEIGKIDQISFTLVTDSGKLVIPTRRLVTEEINIIS